MKLTLLQENLVKSLTAASRIITTKAQMPILGHIKLDANQHGLTISATDLEIGLQLQSDAQVEEPGTLTVPARVITELISNTGPGKLTLESKDTELKISGESINAKVSGMSADEYPELPNFEAEKAIEIPSQQLIQAVDKVAFSAATEDSRPVLTAIQIKITPDGLELAATDGFRLSWLQLPTKAQLSEKSLAFLIPARALQEMARLTDPANKTIKFTPLEKGNQVIFQIGHIQLTSRLISGDYPDVQKVMPDTGDTTVEMDRQELLRSMRLASIFARESANIVKFNIGGGVSTSKDNNETTKQRNNQVTITANAPQVGGQESTVEASVEGPPSQIAFNYRYVLDFLNAGNSSSVKLLMTTALGPGLWLESASSKKSQISYKHVIMPVRVESETS